MVKILEQFLRQQWNRATDRKTSKGIELEWRIYNSIKYLFVEKKISFIFIKKKRKRNYLHNNLIISVKSGSETVGLDKIFYFILI